MSFTPVLLGTGYGGWTALTRTRDRQMQALAQTSAQQKDDAYFRSKIGTVKTAADLVGDRRLLNIALSAFGLEGDINNRAFIRRVLEDGTLKTDALANKLADKRYADFSRAFGFDLSVPRTQISDFADKILSSYKVHRFEAVIGEQNESMRLALNAQRELPEIASGSGSVNTKWFKVLGSTPLRKFVEGALGLPSAFGAIDLDQQVVAIRNKMERVLGSDSPDVLSDPSKMDKLIRLYLAREGQTTTTTGGAQMALQLITTSRG